MKKLFLFLLLLMPVNLYAGEIPSELSWVPPTEYVNGLALPPENIASYEIVYSIDSTSRDLTTLITIPPNTSHQITVMVPDEAGTHTLNFWVRVRLVDDPAIVCTNCVSAWSNMASKSYNIDFNPNAPSGLQFIMVNISCGAGCNITEVTP